MNKQELTEKYIRTLFEYIYRTFLSELLQLDEPQKVTVPQFVAGWMNYCKLTGVDLYHAFEMSDLYLGNYAYQKDYPKLKDYFKSEKNQETFARAWLDGYEVEVEEEKQYYVKFKFIEDSYSYLTLIKHLDAWTLHSITLDKKFRTKHTKKQLEEAGFGEVFNSTLFEVKEAEEWC